MRVQEIDRRENNRFCMSVVIPEPAKYLCENWNITWYVLVHEFQIMQNVMFEKNLYTSYFRYGITYVPSTRTHIVGFDPSMADICMIKLYEYLISG